MDNLMMVEINSSEDWVVMDFTFPTKVGWGFICICILYVCVCTGRHGDGKQIYVWASSHSGA